MGDGNPQLWGDASHATDAPSLDDMIADWAYDLVWVAAGPYPHDGHDAAKQSRMDSAVAFLREAARQVPDLMDVTDAPRKAGMGQYVKTVDRENPDGVRCLCGNEVHVDGFYPADVRRGKLVSPDRDSGWDGFTIACMSCGLCIDTRGVVARPIPATGEWAYDWEHPVCGWIALPDDPTLIPGL